MSDEWIESAIQRMGDKGLISEDLAANLRKAKDDGKIRKELYVVQDTPHNENTVIGSLAETYPEHLGITNVHIIKLGESTT